MASAFDEGKLPCEFITEETLFYSCFDSSAPPKPLLIATPTVNGTYPVLLLLHGFYLRNYFYKGLLQHIASHGVIVVAPQLYSLVPPTGPEEIESAAKVVNWLPQGLQSLLPENVVADLTKVALSGHSRGGKAAFELALGQAEASLSLKFSVLIGIDPVAGANKYCRTNPHILTYVPGSFDLNIPVAVIGTGLGPEKKNGCVSQPCAPDGVNQKEFDLQREQTPLCTFCGQGLWSHGHAGRRSTGHGWSPVGMYVQKWKRFEGPNEEVSRWDCCGFFECICDGEDGDLLAIVADPALSPAKLEPVRGVYQSMKSWSS